MTNVIKFTPRKIEKNGPYFAGRPLYERFPNLRPKPKLPKPERETVNGLILDDDNGGAA
ncbi:hypothetical protein [Rhizobium tubonense]|uniref:hypothetical protein n=1 Tax=Rhizobium tubonense TaxID=484088 RepID=UPI0012B6AB43|nr:hypothetical protein [Rhizobium tubonense]